MATPSEKAGLLLSALLVGLVNLSSQGLDTAAGGTTSVSGVIGSFERSPARYDLYQRLPLTFERNAGQTDGRVKFMARGPGYTLFLTANEAVLALRKSEARSQKSGAKSPEPETGNSKFETRNSGQLSLLPAPDSPFASSDPPAPSPESRAPAVLRMKLVGANLSTRVVGLDQRPGQSNYFVGNDPQKWRTDVLTYAKVKYQGVYPGIDAVYYGNQGQLEYDFVVAPGANLKAIALKIEAGKSKIENRKSKLETGQSEIQNQKSKIRVDANGELVLGTGGGEVRLRRPLAYQTSGDSKRWVQARYALRGENRIGFEVGRYDRRSQLVIDPVLSYATYLGGTGGDVAYGIAVDSSGAAYVTGSTASSNFPVASAEQTAYAGGGDVFVTKFNPTGSAPVYSTYLGGSGPDVGSGIVVDSSGAAYVVGTTSSTNFPTTANAYQSAYAGNGDAFIAKLSPTGSALVYSSYLGGTGADFGQAIALDSSGNAYVAGSTESTDFPTVNPLQVGKVGSSDAFVTKINPSGTGLVYSTYLGGSGADSARAVAVDGSGNLYLAGYTLSIDFPTQNPLQSSNRGGSDVFVAELNAAGSGLVYSTYLGGSRQDRAFGLALDASGSVYVAGDTQSTDFPVTSNALQASNHGQGDAFVSKLALGGSALVYSTFLGGSGPDQAAAVALDSLGDAYVTGLTQSSDFLTADPLQRILGIAGAGSCGMNLCPDVFLSKLGPSGAVVYSTYLGGSGADSGQAVALDSSGAVYLAGSTASQNFPAIAGAPQGSYAGSASSNAFVAKVNGLDAPGMALTPQQVNFGNQALNSGSDPRTVALTNAGSAPLDITSIVAGGDFAQTNNCGAAVPAGGGTCAIQITFTPTTPGNKTDQISIADNANGSPHVITVTGNGVNPAGSLTPSPSSLSFPAESVNVTSPAQPVRLTNNGQVAVTLTAISATGDFSETNTCGALPSALNKGDSCTVNVTFTPTASGSRTGAVSVTDDAANSPQSVPLTGTGNPLFSLSANARSAIVVIGTDSTTFTVNASAPSSFLSSISLTCSSAGGASCSFNPSSITAGQSSTLTVSGLTSSSSNPLSSNPANCNATSYATGSTATTPIPLNLTITGTSGSETSTLTLSIFFADFCVSASPPLRTINAGQSASYTIYVSPSNGFNQVVLLSCSGVPAASSCSWSPSALTLNGTAAATATMTVSTTVESTRSVRRPPPYGGPSAGPLFGSKPWALWLMVLASAAALASRRERGRLALMPLSERLRFAALGVALFLFALGTSCSHSATVSGTPPGTTAIGITGTLGNNSKVSRTATVNLSVGF